MTGAARDLSDPGGRAGEGKEHVRPFSQRACEEILRRWSEIRSKDGGTISIDARAPRGPRVDLEFASTVSAWLARCPHRVATGHPRDPHRTITLAEQWIIAQLEAEHQQNRWNAAVRTAGLWGAVSGAHPGDAEAARELERTTAEAEDMQLEMDVWFRLLEDLERAPLFWQAVGWLGAAFARCLAEERRSSGGSEFSRYELM